MQLRFDLWQLQAMRLLPMRLPVAQIESNSLCIYRKTLRLEFHVMNIICWFEVLHGASLALHLS